MVTSKQCVLLCNTRVLALLREGPKENRKYPEENSFRENLHGEICLEARQSF